MRQVTVPTNHSTTMKTLSTHSLGARLCALLLVCIAFSEGKAWGDIDDYAKPEPKPRKHRQIETPKFVQKVGDFILNLVERIDPDPAGQAYWLDPDPISKYRQDPPPLHYRVLPQRPTRYADDNAEDRSRVISPAPKLQSNRYSESNDSNFSPPNRSGLAPEPQFRSSREELEALKAAESRRQIKPPAPLPEEAKQDSTATTGPSVNEPLKRRDPLEKQSNNAQSRTESPENKSRVAENPAGKDLPVATRINKPGRVKSPYPPYSELNITRLPGGSLAKDPSTGQVFRLPH